MKALAIDLGGSHATCGIVEDRELLACKVLDIDRASGSFKLTPASLQCQGGGRVQPSLP